MEMTGERRIPAPREKVWAALNDPAVLQAAIPGCESVERIADDQFQAKVAMKLGPMSARFGGKVTLSNINPPASYTISGEGQGGAMGFAKGGADVALDEVGPEETTLRYNVKAQVGGKMAQLGARLIDSTAKSMADQFFDRFAAQLGATPGVEAASSANGDANTMSETTHPGQPGAPADCERPDAAARPPAPPRSRRRTPTRNTWPTATRPARSRSTARTACPRAERSPAQQPRARCPSAVRCGC
jgi:carbon monoxide dehydrogenase subunit G